MTWTLREVIERTALHQFFEARTIIDYQKVITTLGDELLKNSQRLDEPTGDKKP